MNGRTYNLLMISSIVMTLIALPGCGELTSNHATSAHQPASTKSPTSAVSVETSTANHHTSQHAPSSTNAADSSTNNTATSMNNTVPPAQSSSSKELPAGFHTYQNVWSTVGPYLAHYTAAPVWMPGPKLTSEINIPSNEWMNVKFRTNTAGYTLTVSVGPKLPANSTKIISGNANMIYSLMAFNKTQPMSSVTTWNDTSAVIPNAQIQSVNLGHGITGKMYTGKLNGHSWNSRDIVWKEDGWTFGWEAQADDESAPATISQAKSIATKYLGTKLPVAAGKFLAARGAGAPSQVEFTLGATRYILYAPGERALDMMATMSQVK